MSLKVDTAFGIKEITSNSILGVVNSKHVFASSCKPEWIKQFDSLEDANQVVADLSLLEHITVDGKKLPGGQCAFSVVRVRITTITRKYAATSPL